MKKYINKIVLGILLLSLIGCSDDFLETYPTDSVAPSYALSSTNDMLATLNGIHRTMYAQNKFEAWSTYAGESYILPLLELNAGDMLHSSRGNGWFINHAKWLRTTNPESIDVGYVWQQYYYIIASANAIINAADGMKESEKLHSILGQSYAYRAFAHHRLVSLFAKNPLYGNPDKDLGVPIMLDVKFPYEGLARETVAKVYTQCENDIKKAIEHLSKSSGVANKSHISLKVANGIAARIALTKGEYANAAKYAKEARKGLKLMKEEDYLAGFNTVNNPEWMWGANIIVDQTNFYRAWFYYIGTNFNGTQNRGNPKKINIKLYKLIADTDYRKKIWLEKAPNTFVGWKKDTNYSTKKEFNSARKEIIKKYRMTSRFKTHPYMSVKFLNKDGGTIVPDDILYMRVAEMYLIEAEALAHTNPTAATKVIEELGKSRDKSYVVSARGLSLLEEIKVQRRIELWGEGHRWLDLLRYDEALDLKGSGASRSLYQKGYKQPKPSASPNWLYQIPKKEMEANKKMKQNPSATL